VNVEPWKHRMNTSRIALVTGAANGIGPAGSQALLRAGHRVVMVDEVAFDPRTLVAPERLAQVQAASFDVTDTAAARELDERLMQTWGPVSILVNNAGISPKLPSGLSAGLLEITCAEWNRVLDVNLSAAMRLCQVFVRRMKASSWGRIVNVSSLAGRARPAFAGASYSASKAALIGLTCAIASEFGAAGITANRVAPGRIQTRMAAQAAKSRTGATPSRYPCAVRAPQPKWPRPSLIGLLKMSLLSTAHCWI
jgi:3-oxoacyl-[acyl-carrier protein] reductase